MKTIPWILIAAAILAQATAGEIYKCKDARGRLVFSQTECGQDAAQVDIHVHQPSQADIQAAQARTAEGDQLLGEIIDARRKVRAVRAQQERIQALERQRAATMASIQRRASYANNNLAGATYRNALATEAQTANQQYQAEIDAARRSMDQVVNQ